MPQQFSRQFPEPLNREFSSVNSVGLGLVRKNSVDFVKNKCALRVKAANVRSNLPKRASCRDITFARRCDVILLIERDVSALPITQEHLLALTIFLRKFPLQICVRGEKKDAS